METKMINVKINGKPVSVPKGTTILDAARQPASRFPLFATSEISTP